MIILSFTCSISNPLHAKAQNILDKSISLMIESDDVKNVLMQIETQADVKFVYSGNMIPTTKRISLKANNLKLSSVLNSILSPLNIGYEVIGTRILLKKQAQASPNAEALKVPNTAEIKAIEQIKGKVTAAGQSLPGVSVVIKGTNKGVLTDVDGNFSINANQGDVLMISFVGYATKSIIVKGNNLDIVLEESANTLQDVVVVGSRSTVARTNVERPVPVDVISVKELQTTGQTEVTQQIVFTSPSFNSAKNAINGVANYADPASLKGLSPDQMLVLVDGKRRHQFSALNSNVTIGKGTVVTDMNSIPSLALERVEILRDGAAAQYGSDAIAGIANLVLKKSVNNGSAQMQYGVTSRGDGGGYTMGLNYGFDLGRGASLNITGSFQDVSGTDRSDTYNPQPITGGTYTGIYTNVKATDEAALLSRGVWGNGTYGSFHVSSYGSNAMKSGQAFYNLDVPLNKGWTLYSFGGLSNKAVSAQAFLRTALPSSATSNVALYPDGYAPGLPGTASDASSFVGLKRKTNGGWNIDLSTGYGRNWLDQFAKNSSNASLGAASPRDFYVGRVFFGQSLTEANISKTMIGKFGTKSLSVALGGQYRKDNFILTPGDPAASEVGPLSATNNKTPGSQGRVGIDKADKTDVNRSNVGIYADVESDITNKFLLAGAVRFENYSDFGSNISGKIASRLKLTDNFAIRGSINKGFRAPLLQQTANAATTSTVQSGIIRSTKQLPSSDARLKTIGIEDPKPETSWNYNLGLTAKLGRDFLFTVDAYQIDIKDRIIVTENLNVNNIAALKANFAGLQEITFFTNAINTGTKGLDVVASYKHDINEKSKLTASVAFTVNKTRITSEKGTPAALQLGTVAKVLLIDTVSRSLIETSQPNKKVLVSVGYQIDKFSVNVRSSYFGEVTAWEKIARPVAGTTNLHRSQTFGGKNLFDVSASYSFNKLLTLSLGGNNVTNVYPDKVFSNYASYANGQVPYTRNANQFGFNGAYYYGSLMLKF